MNRQTRWLARVFVLSLAIVGAIAEAPSALANTYYPSNCSQSGVVQPWSNSCWLGQYYINYGTDVLGLQFELAYQGPVSPGTPDCDFGPNTDNAVIAWQQAHGLTQDGIVGSATYASLQGAISYAGVSDEYGDYYNNGSDALRFYYANRTASPTWFVLDPYYYTGSSYVNMIDLSSKGVFCP